MTQRFWIFNFAPHSRDALTRGFLMREGRGRRTENRRQRAEGKRSGLGVTLLRSVSGNLAELRRAQTRFRALAGKDIC